jgi:hypothetical protein
MEERSAGVGVILDPRHENLRPTGDQAPDPEFYHQLSSEVQDKGFLVTSTEDLFQWARTGSLVVDDVRPRLLRGRDDPREHAALRP